MNSTKVIIFLITFGLFSSICLAKPDDDNWRLVYSDKYTNYYLETQSVSPRTTESFFYYEVWYKCEYTMEGIEKNVNSLKNPTDEEISLNYNIGSVISYAQIAPSKWEYVVLKRIIYDRNGRVLKVINENPDTSPRLKFNPNSPLDQITRESIRITIEKMNENKEVSQ